MTPRRPKGLPEKISTATGTVLARDAGIITFTTTVDADGNVISQSVSESGPHSEADSDFTLFCQAVTPPTDLTGPLNRSTETAEPLASGDASGSMCI